MTALGSSTSKKWVKVGMIVVIVALVGMVLRVLISPNHGGKSIDKGIALAVAKAVYSGNAGAFQHLFRDEPYKGGFVDQVSKQVYDYGPVKEVVHTPEIPPTPEQIRTFKARFPGHDVSEFRPPCPGMSNWKVVAERGNYTIRINVEDRYLVGCDFRLPAGEFGTGSM